VFIATAAAIYSLEHGLYTFTAVLRSFELPVGNGRDSGIAGWENMGMGFKFQTGMGMGWEWE